MEAPKLPAEYKLPEATVEGLKAAAEKSMEEARKYMGPCKKVSVDIALAEIVLELWREYAKYQKR